ncbi:ABC transporter ATP-binding protein/permease [Pseudofrankia sp. DC12]|uniref:ABC transporter ATP-binding protein/permease n=1 Tax=Pseudofrankia sp. DC12 TaxID=683315 RepID=UPI0005F862AB|nr:ABC transporter ATP-binding protein/permease [Pseudofrankia sp. DC12]
MLLLFVGAWRTATGTLEIGDVVAIWGFWMRGSTALTQVMTSLPDVLAGTAASERTAELLQERPAVADRPQAPALAVTRGGVAFEGVWFAYPGRESRVCDIGTHSALLGSSPTYRSYCREQAVA